MDAPRAAEGEGRCTIYGPTNPEPLVRWDHAWTVLFTPVRDRVASDKREQFIAMQMRKDEANAAPAASAGPPDDSQYMAATSPSTHA